MTQSALVFQVFVLQQFDPGMEYRPEWGFTKHQVPPLLPPPEYPGPPPASLGRSEILRGMTAKLNPTTAPAGQQQQQQQQPQQQPTQQQQQQPNGKDEKS